MRKLILSDIDGTLLPEDGAALPEALFHQIRRLSAAGIGFCPASGRQYTSMRRLFAPVAEELIYLCENGAVLMDGQRTVLGKTVMPRAEAVALSRDILAAAGCEVLISGQDMSYVIPKKEDMVTLMRDTKGNNVTVLDDPAQVPEDIVKIAVYCAAGAAHIPPQLAARWSRFHPAVAGRAWLDFTLSDKGTGLAQLCRALSLRPEDIIAFGDNYNDIPMLSRAGTAYIMSTAAPALLARFPLHCADVVEVLRQLEDRLPEA